VNLSALFIRRPVTTTLIMAGILIFGVMAYTRLPVSDLPNVDFPTIVVSAQLPGASPETMAASVATPLEKQFSTIAGITSMSSANTPGSTRITLQFELSRNLDAAAQDVQAAIAVTSRRLPAQMPFPPSYRKVNPAAQAILFLVLTSPTLPLYALDEYGETLIAQRISMVDGVAQVLVFGSQKYAVRIKLDPQALSSLGLGIDEVAGAVQAANANLPTGTLDGRSRAFTVEASGQLNHAQDYKKIVLAYRNGSAIRLADVADVLDSVETDKVAAWYMDQRAIILAVQRQPGTNTVAVIDAVKKLLPTFQAQMPASVSLGILFDRSDSIKASVRDVKFTLLFVLCLVVVVILLFLRRVTTTIIPSLAMPMSLLGTFLVMYVLNFSLDNLSLMALILSIGFVVDDAIVMLENIIRHVEMGEPPLEATYNGSKEVGLTIVSMTLSLAAVFIPVLFMGGIVGRLFNEFAVTIAAAVLVSGLVSLTLTPMLCGLFLKSAYRETAGRAVRDERQSYNVVLRLYGYSLSWVLRHRFMTMVFSAIVLVLAVVLFRMLPKGFIPSQDTGQISVNTEADQGISFDSMVRHQQAVAALAKADPNVDAFMSSVGGGGMTGLGNSGSLFIRLKPRKDRRLSADQVIAELRPKLSQVPGIRVFLQNPPLINIGGQQTRSLYQFTLQGPNTNELYRVAPILQEKMRALPGLLDVSTDLLIKNPRVIVDIDRDKAAVLGVSATRIEDALYTAYGSRQISTIFAPTNDYQVIMELKPQFELDPSALALLKVRAANGQLISLDTVAGIRQGIGPAAVNHLGQLPAVTISFNLKPGVSLGDAVKQIEPIARATLPPTISSSFQGTAQAFQSSMAGMGLLLLMAVLVIYLVLGILYESFIHPITILSALPFAGFGALVTLLIFKTELNLYGFVGVIMLIGLVKKNGIMMIDFALATRRSSDKTAAEAIFRACMIRFRPIMMTTVAALVGTIPIAAGLGAGGETRQPLGLAVVGGLVFSQLLTLYVTPVFFTYMEGLSDWLKGSARRPQHPASE
jgi:HAE1 family hydrophobic/amphiphilic exporter-1